ncbi:hypothetical protein GGR15_002328 [Butyricimonas paravirosa]|uniref:Uncharacterized protein n=1 Tax=Butyricimonas paravirosa TaxID=1472417 RepID=A0A7X5YCP9_9BACT|nr:hypothetical protein [Butyricimonas paravirosa]
MLEDKRQIDVYHRVLHPAAASPVAGIGSEVIQNQKLHRVGIVVDVDESLVGQSDGIRLFQIDRQNCVRLFRIGQFQTEGEPAVAIDLRNQPYSLPLIDVELIPIGFVSRNDFKFVFHFRERKHLVMDCHECIVLHPVAQVVRSCRTDDFK